MKKLLYMVVHIDDEQLEGTTPEAVLEDIVYHAEKSGYVITEQFVEDANSEEEEDELL